MRSSTSTTPTGAASSSRASSSSCSGESPWRKTLGPTPILTLTLPLSTGVVEAIPKTLPLPLTPGSDLLSRQVSPGVEVTEADEAYVLEMVDRCADTHLPVRATHACLLRAVRSEEA